MPDYTNMVMDLYEKHTGNRPAQDSGIAYWAGQMERGQDPQSLMKNMLGQDVGSDYNIPGYNAASAGASSTPVGTGSASLPPLAARRISTSRKTLIPKPVSIGRLTL